MLRCDELKMRMFTHEAFICLVVIILLTGIISAQDDNENDREIVINPGANLMIGTIMQVHGKGHEIFDCGAPTEQGIIKVEALKWITAMLNQERDTHFLPGISLGIKIYDTCGRFREAVNLLQNYQSSIDSEETLVNNSSSVYQLGLIDGGNLIEDKEIQSTLVNQNVPVVNMDSEKMMILPEDRAQGMVTLIQELKWGRVFVIYDNSDYGIKMMNSFLDKIKNENICVEGVKKIILPEKVKSFEDDINSHTVDAIFLAISHGTPLTVLMRRSNYILFLEYLNHDQRNASSAKMFFSDLLTEAEFRILPKNISEMYSISFSPDHIPAFEKYWKKQIEDVKSNHIVNAEDKWLKEYLNLRHNCSVLENNDNNISQIHCDKLMHAGLLQYNILGVTLRTIEVITASEAVLCLAEAFKQAWDSKCMNATSEPCEDVMNMTHDEFVESYYRYPFFDNMTKDSPIFRLIKYHQVKTDIIVKKIMLYNQYGKREFLAEDFKPSAVEMCSPAVSNAIHCEKCNITKPTRIDGGRHYGSHSSSNSVQLLQPTVKLSKPHFINNHFRVLVHSPQNLYVALIISIHKSPSDRSVHECGGDEDLDVESVRQLEAFLWALDKINANLQNVTSSDVQIGAILLDACNSKVRTWSLTSGLSQHLPVSQGYEILAIVNALCLHHAISASEILSALNISSVSTSQSLSLMRNQHNQFLFQVEAPLSSMAESVVGILKHLGWSYVSVVFSAADEEYVYGYKSFQETASKAGICLAMEEALYLVNISANSSMVYGEIVNLVRQLVEARAGGARAVVLWLNEIDMHIFMKGVSQSLAQDVLRKEDLFWIFCSPDGKAFDILQDFGNTLGGALVLSPQQRPVPQFLHHLKELDSNNTSKEGSRNPWLHKYYQEEEKCKIFLGARNHEDFNMIQAVYSIGAGLVNSVSLLCNNTMNIKSDADKLCISQHSRSEVQQIINHNILHSIAERADTLQNGGFKFMNNGMGIINTELFNLKHKSHDRGLISDEIYFEKVNLSAIYNNETLINLVTYRDNGIEVPLSGVTSQCGSRINCPQCKAFSSLVLRDLVIVKDSNDQTQNDLYIAATFSIHETSRNPLECGTDVKMQGIEEMEAFLWAVDQINVNNTKVNLTPVIFDTCDSSIKTSRDVANFLENRDGNGKHDKKGNVIAFITGGNTNLVGPVMDLAGHLSIPVLATQAGGPPPHRKNFAPYPLQLSTSSYVQSFSLLSLIKHMRWTCVTVIYHQDGIEYEDMHRYMKQQSQLLNISTTISSEIGIPVGNVNITAHLRKALGTVQRLPTIGPKVVVMLLPPERIDLLFRTVHSLEDEGLLFPYNLVWVSLFGSEEVLLKYSDKALGAIVLQPKMEHIKDFESYFKTLKLSGNVRNPWFSEFWSNVFHCRGAACHNHQDLHTYTFKHNTVVVNTINAVMAVSHAVETVNREICQDIGVRSSTCSAMQDINRVRRRLYETTPSMAFVGAGLKTVAFTDTGENSRGDIEVINLQKNYGESMWVPVGTITPSGAVNIDLMKTKVYLSEDRNETSIQNVHMQCRIQNNTNQNTAYVMEIPSKSKLSILTLMPVHFQGNRLLECGLLKQDALYHLASLSYMLHSINTNSSVLPGIDIGLIVLDTCSRYSHAFNVLNNFIVTSTKNKDTPQQIKFEDVITSLLINVESSDIITPLLDAQNVSQMLISTRKPKDTTESSHMNSLSRSSLIQAILSVSHVTRTHSIIIIHGTTPWADLVAQDLHSKIYSQRQFTCLAGMFAMHSSNINNLDGAISSTELTARQDIVDRLIPGTMIVLILEDLEDVQAFLEVAKVMDGLIFLLVLPKLNAHFYAGQNVFTMSPSPENKEEDLEISLNLEEWITATQEQVAQLPERWLLEYYSNSNLNNTSLYLKEKPGKHIHIPFPKNFKDFVHDSVKTGWATAKKLHKYLKNYCSKNFTYLSMSECYSRSDHANLTKNIRHFLYKDSVNVISKNEIITNFDLWIGSEHIGMWDDETGLMIHNPNRIPTFQTNCVNSECTICAQGVGFYTKNKHNVPRRNVQYSWAATLGGLTLFAAFLTIVTALYFLTAAALPRNNRNCEPSVLDYLILLGILLLFSSNLSFFLTPSEATCGARRFLPGFSYALIFSGMFIKVYTTWHYRGSTKFEVLTTYKPANVLMMAIALSMVQVLLAGGWLLLIPPQAYVVTSINPHIWRCYPQGNFESHLILSFIYVILLLSATVVMALLCFSSFKKGREADEKPLYYEANWILLCSILVATIFTFWGIATVIVLSTSQVDLASALTQLILGMVLLLCLFAPKIFLYRRLRKNRGTGQTAMQPTIYDISHLQPPTLKGMAGISGMGGIMETDQNPNVCLLQCKKLKESRMWNTKDKAFLPSTSVSDIDLPSLGDENDESSESDPTQVVPSSLYSLDMFSNSSGSQKNEIQDDDPVDDDEGRGEHCEPGTNEFSAAHSSVMFLKRECFPVQETTSYL